jgi:protein-tyrosine phosphatase
VTWPDFSVIPLYSHIDGNLWMGGKPVISPHERFQTVLSLDGWTNYECHPHQRLIVVPMFDREEMPMPDGELLQLADEVNRWCNEGPTLVHCTAGLNRSGLVVALALMKRGLSADAAIAHLRRKRSSEVLHNKTFERWLRAFRERQ